MKVYRRLAALLIIFLCMGMFSHVNVYAAEDTNTEVSESGEEAVSSEEEEISDSIRVGNIVYTFTDETRTKYIITDIVGKVATTLTLRATVEGIPVIGFDSVALMDNYYYNRIEELILPKNYKEICDYGFAGMKSLKRIEMTSVTKIGEGAFLWCEALEEVKFSSKLKSIGNDAFYGCSSLKQIILPSSCTFIGKYAFEDCTALTYAYLPGIKYVNTKSFLNCTALTKVTLGEKLTMIYDTSFMGCTNLQILYCKGTTPPYVSSRFQLAESTRIYCQSGLKEAYTEAFYVSTKVKNNKNRIYEIKAN